MTVPPLCVHCQQHPVRRWYRRQAPIRGWRRVEGLAWRWFCSPACVQADKAAHQTWRLGVADARRRAAAQARQAELEGEVTAFVKFGVPRAYARAVLDRIAYRWFRKGERGAFYRYVERRPVRSRREEVQHV